MKIRRSHLFPFVLISSGHCDCSGFEEKEMKCGSRLGRCKSRDQARLKKNRQMTCKGMNAFETETVAIETVGTGSVEARLCWAIDHASSFL